jgi:glycosyltransferase involved in cell wall biosynthesis
MRYPTLQELPPPPQGKKGWPWVETSPMDQVKLNSSSDWPKVSIVTPSYNQAGFIEETIRSVLLQQYPNIEYIIIDGGSTDGSVDIIRKYEPWLSYWVSEPDRGQSHAINKGWNHSSGDVIAWLNSDDLYEPNTFRDIALYFAENPEIHMIYGDCKIINKESEITDDAPIHEYDLKPLVCNEWFISQPTVFIRKEVLEIVGFINESFYMVMDWEFFLRIALAGFTIKYFKCPLARFRIWEDAKTTRYHTRAGREKLLVLDNIFSNQKYLPQIACFKNEAYGFVHSWTARANARERNSISVLTHYYRAIGYQPELSRDKRLIKVTRKALLGTYLFEKIIIKIKELLKTFQLKT